MHKIQKRSSNTTPMVPLTCKVFDVYDIDKFLSWTSKLLRHFLLTLRCVIWDERSDY